ncbi:MAG TPA: hypothetical protein VGJ70_13505, partial [Solirubrobacteraceae bacterium]
MSTVERRLADVEPAAGGPPDDDGSPAGVPGPREAVRRLAQGELGSLRVLLVLAIVWIVFAIAHDR